MLSDHIHLGVLDVNVSILPSGRIGIEKDSIERLINPFRRSKISEDIDEAIKKFDTAFESENENLLDPIDISDYEKAFKAEFGLTASQIVAFFYYTSTYGLEQKRAVPFMKLSEITKKLADDTELTKEEVKTAINLFSLSKRSKWEEAPDGFTFKEDIAPWRYNRRLSYIRRPIIQTSHPPKDPLLYWGSRHVEECSKQLIGSVTSGRYKIYDNTAEEMKILIGNIQERSGKEFAANVESWLRENTEWLLECEITIGPRGKLEYEHDLGDIDVLAINAADKYLFSIECKNVNFGRNPREIANEIEKIYEDKKNKESWITKHIKRDGWLKDNTKAVLMLFRLPLEEYKVKSFIITSEEIPAVYIIDLDLTIFSMSRLHNEGIDIIRSIM